MEKIEFLAGTGLTFHTPEHDHRLNEALLSRRWEFRVLRSASGHFSLQQGPTPITTATTASGEILADAGRVALTFADALAAGTRKWLPLPYARQSGSGGAPSRSADWMRVFLDRPPLAREDDLHRFTYAIDTTLHPALPAEGTIGDVFGFRADDVGLPFTAQLAAPGFWQSPTLLTWVQRLFREVRAEGSEQTSPLAAALAAYMVLIDGLSMAGLLPEVTLMAPEGEPIDVHLVLDLGNSRACGLLAECEPGRPVDLDACKKLELRDLRRPSEVYSEPFDTTFRFVPPLFADPENPVPHAGAGFVWPSIVRLGTEAARLEPAEVGDTGMSSPKRYLWDDQPHPYPWYFNLPGGGLGVKIQAPFLALLDEAGRFHAEGAAPPFEPRYPPTAMMTLVGVEILNHVYAQINGLAYRRFRGHRLARRHLRSVVVTSPCGMSRPEKAIYRERMQAAIDLFFSATGRPKEDRPELHFDFDEATCSQLTWLYGEVRHRFLGDAHAALATLGQEREPAGSGGPASAGAASAGPIGAGATGGGSAGPAPLTGPAKKAGATKGPILRLASIDIGGGTADFMISEFAPDGSDPSAVKQTMLFSEGFTVAGDEIARRLIEKVILRQVFAAAQEKKPGLAFEEFQTFFGPGRAGRDKAFLDLKAELNRQVWIPMAHAFLAFAEADSEEASLELRFDAFFRQRQPAARVLDFFTTAMRQEFGLSLTLAEIPWVLARRRLHAVVASVMESVLRAYSEVIAQFDCDALVLGGRPSSLPAIRELLVKFMPVVPERIIGLKGFAVGDWYPFALKGGGIADPKTACVVGATIWLFAEKLHRLPGLTLRCERGPAERREGFIGSFSPEVLTLDRVLFPAGRHREAELQVHKTQMLGIRRIDADLCLVNPLYELKPDPERLGAPGPYKVVLAQDEQMKEALSLVRVEDGQGRSLDVRGMGLRLRTLVQEQDRLDTGSFDL